MTGGSSPGLPGIVHIGLQEEGILLAGRLMGIRLDDGTDKRGLSECIFLGVYIKRIQHGGRNMIIYITPNLFS